MEFSDVQLRILIDEQKQKNAEYHATSNKKKRLFWENIANRINKSENTNYFTGEDCHKKFLYLTKAFYVSNDCLGSILAKYTYYYFIRRQKNIEKEKEIRKV